MLRAIVKSAPWLRGLGRGVAIAALATLIVALLLARGASAHAVVVRSDPADSSVLAASPQDIRLWFSEPFSPQFTQAVVLNVRGESVAAQVHADSSDPTLLVISAPALPDGVYNVVYSTLSAADSHATQGHVVFRVGAGATAVAPAPQPAVPWFEAILRWLDFTALAGVTGAVAVAFFLLKAGRPLPANSVAVAVTLAQARRRVLGFGAWCATAAVALGLALLFWQVTLLASPAGPGGGPPAVGAALRLLSQTRSGLLWMLRQVCLTAIASLLLRLRRTPAPARSAPATDLHTTQYAIRSTPSVIGAVLGLLCAGALTAQALTGHAAAVTPNTGIAAFMDVLHLAAAGLWTGGLLALAAGLLPLALARRGEPAFAALVYAGWRPFGALAAVSVGVLFATGLYNMGSQVASIDALLTTFYGRTLLIKMALVLGTGMLGLLNATLFHPQLAAPWARLFRRSRKPSEGNPGGWTPLPLARFPALVLSEVAVGLLVLLATGLMTAGAPPHGPQFAPAEPVVQEPTLVDRAGDLLITLDAKPNQPGQNIVTIGVANTRRPAPAEIMRVIVHLTYLGQSVGVVTTDAQKVSPTSYQVIGDQLSLAGPWLVEVVVRRKGLEDSATQFRWTVAEPGLTRRPLVSDRPLKPWLTLAATILLMAVLVAAALAWLKPRPVAGPKATGGEQSGLIGSDRA